MLVSDNGPQFVLNEFKDFMKANGVQHITSAPYHPSTNRLAERFVQSLKQGLRKNPEGSASLRLAKFLFAYRNTPHAAIRKSPATLMLGRRLRSRLDLLKPSTAAVVTQSRFDASRYKSTVSRTMQEGDTMRVRNYRGVEKWMPDKITKKTGPVSYQVCVKTPTGDVTWNRHQDQLLITKDDTVGEPEDWWMTVSQPATSVSGGPPEDHVSATAVPVPVQQVP